MSTPVSSGQSVSLPSETCENHKKKLGWLGIGPSLRLWRSHWRGTWYITSAACRSLYNHIHISLPTRLPIVDLGRATVSPQDGILRASERAVARHEYIQKLLAIYPWVDIVDLRIFLMGFDAGEQWADGTQGSPARTPSETSWLTSLSSDSRQQSL